MFPAYLIEGSMNEHQLNVKPRGLRPEQTLTNQQGVNALRDSNSQKTHLKEKIQPETQQRMSVTIRPI
jgi:hypothetical protein